MMCALHIFKDRALTDRLRCGLEDGVNSTTWKIEMEKVLANPLLLSVYAETLRLHLQAYVTRSSPHCDVKLGSWWLPKNSVCMVNTYASHMDSSFWNTCDGTFPVESFWADRFLIDPKNPRGGPVRYDVPISQYKRPTPPEGRRDKDAPFFSV